MKNKKPIHLILLAALGVNLILIGLASADTVTTMDQQINAGSLSIDQVPGASSFSQVNVSLTSQSVDINTAADSLKYSDMRGQRLSSYALTVVNTQFLDVDSGQTIDVGQFEVKGHSGINPGNLGDSVKCTLGSARSTLATMSGAAVWMYRDITLRARVMQCGASPEFRLTVPGQTSAGVYRTTLTWSLS
jgi:hypothetical protein